MAAARRPLSHIKLTWRTPRRFGLDTSFFLTEKGVRGEGVALLGHIALLYTDKDVR
jgi:hypothetical protein